MNLVSVIIPVYNVEDFLEQSIESILDQTYSNWELILVNDGSQDHSGDICDMYSQKDSRILTVHQENKGPGLARQTGIDHSQGDYICFVDADDYLKKTAIKNNVKIMNRHQVDLIVNSYYELEINDNNKRKKTKRNLLISGCYKKEEFRKVYSDYRKVGDRALWNKFYRSQFLKENKIEFSRSPIGEDGEFNYKVYEHLNNVYLDENAYYVYDTSREDSTIKKYRENKIKLEIQLIKAHEKMFHAWDMYDEYAYIISLELVDALIFELDNLFTTVNDLTFSQKIRLFKDYASYDTFSNAVENLNMSKYRSPQAKLFFFLLKNKYYFLICTYYQIRSLI